MNRIYQDLMVGIAGKAVLNARSVQSVDHYGLKGRLREILVRDLLKPFLPDNFLIGTGQIISSYGDRSNEIDVVVCDRRVVPPILLDSASGIFPIESALVTVEVKSKLDAKELRTSHISAARVEQFKHAPALDGSSEQIEHVIPYVFAFDSDLKGVGKSETDRYDEIRGDENPSILGICVVGRGFWFWDKGRWVGWQSELEFGAVVGFVTAIVNTWQRTASTRRQPNLTGYWL